MLRLAALTFLLTASVGATAAYAQQPAPTPTAAPAASTYSVEDTDLGTLLDDPASKAVLTKHLPEIVKSDQIEMARSMTLRQIQSFAADKISEDALTKIQADLSKLPGK